jgi:hypothetical protein
VEQEEEDDVREDPDEDSINAILIAEMMQTKPDEGDREAPLKDETRRRRRRRQRWSRRRKLKTKSTTGQEEEEEEEEEEDQRRTMPACHRKIRSDGKADEEAKYQKANTK